MPIPKDYKEFIKNPAKCRLFSWEILKELIEYNKEIFKASDVAEIFKLSLAEACTRVNVMKRYGWIKQVRPETYPATYQVTNWGKRYYSYKVGNTSSFGPKS